MYKTKLFILTFIWLILVLGSFWMLFSTSSESKIAYQCLINQHDKEKKERLKEEIRPMQQERLHVSKQILYTKGSDRMQSKLRSDSSHLFYSKQTGELTEEFKGLTCFLQDKLIHASKGDDSNSKETPLALTQQVVRHLKADEAFYSYKTGQLEANNVDIAHFLLPGTTCPDSLDQLSPIFTGKAQTLLLSLFKEPSLKAHGFQGVLHSWGDE